MGWCLDKNRPICPQICEQVCVKIAKGEFLPNERLLSVRDVAVEAGVNPNTVQKSFEELERQKLIYSVRGSGWFVGEDIETAKQTVELLIHGKTTEFFNQMHGLGLTDSQIKEIVEEWSE